MFLSLWLYRCKLKSLDTTGILLNNFNVSKGSDSNLWSTKITNDSIPDVGKGKLLSYAANSPAAYFPPGFAAYFGGAYFLSSFLGG